MGQAMGEAMWAALKVVAFVLFFGGIGAISGIVALIALAAKSFTVAKVAGIICGASFGTILVAGVATNYAANTDARQWAAFRKNSARAKEKAKTPLLRAIDALDEEKVKKLIEKGADVNKEAGARTPLTAAISQKKKYYTEIENPLEISDRIIALLLEAGADANQRVEAKEEPWYIFNDDKERVDWDYMPPLPISVAIENDRPDALKLLIKHGAIIDSVNFDLFDELKAQGVVFEKVFPKECVYDFFPVQWAMRENSYKCLEILLEAGARPTVWYYEKENETLLMELFSRNETDREELFLHILDMLVDYAPSTPKMKDIHGNTAFHYYANNIFRHSENNPLVARLVEKGGDINEANDEGKTPLMCAVYKKDTFDLRYLNPVLRTLIDAGADRAKKDADGKTALDIFRETFRDNDKTKWSDDELSAYMHIEALLAPKLAAAAPLPSAKTALIAKNTAAPKTDFTADAHSPLDDIADGW